MSSEHVKNKTQWRCPTCNYPVGEPVDQTGEKYELGEQQSLCVCCRCFAVLWLRKDRQPEPVDNKTFFQICVMRPREMIRTMELSLAIHARVKSEDN